MGARRFRTPIHRRTRPCAYTLYGILSRTGVTISTSAARIELRVKPATKAIIQQAAALSQVSLTDFITDIVLTRAQELVNGVAAPPTRQPRPIGGWTFDLPDGWDAPLDDLAEYR